MKTYYDDKYGCCRVYVVALPTYNLPFFLRNSKTLVRKNFAGIVCVKFLIFQKKV